MDHQASGDAGGVNGAAGRAAACLGLRLSKQRPRIVLAAPIVGDGKDTDHLRQHPAIDPELRATTDRPLNRLPGRNRIDTTKNRFAGAEPLAVAIVEGFDLDCPVELADAGPATVHLCDGSGGDHT
jgi:hypothetical protein